MFMKRVSTGILTASMLASAFAPAAFAADVEISGNGSNSNNTVAIVNTDTTNVSQTNNTTVNTNVNAVANTGGNKANKNTGGDVTVDTGDAANTVNVSVEGGSNTAVLPEPCGCAEDLSVLVSGNGNKSDNTVALTSAKTNLVKQKNNLKVKTDALLKAKTGKNKANKNTGGTVDLTTGNAANTLDVSVTGSSNNL